MRALAEFALVLVVGGCGHPESDTKDSAGSDDTAEDDSVDTGSPDSDSPGDSDTTTDTGDGDSETGDTADTADSGELVCTSDSGFPAGFDLDTVAVAKLLGEAVDDAGPNPPKIAVAGAGDVDADGYDDLLIGVAFNQRGGTDNAGSIYLFRGSVTGTMSLGLADAIRVGEWSATLGASVASAGDVNGDGFDDVIAGAPMLTVPGDVFVFYGPIEGIEAATYKPDARMTASSSFMLGATVAHLGDANGDGVDDLLFGSDDFDAYVVYGPPGSGDADASAAFAFHSKTSDGSEVAGGDVDGDGLADVILSAATGTATEGSVFLAPLPISADLSDRDIIVSNSTSDVGYTFFPKLVPDTNCDGYPEFVLDAVLDGTYGLATGAVYVFEGPLAATEDTTAADAKLVGPAEYTNTGYGIAGTGDIDGDGFGDFAVSSPAFPAGGPGTAWVVWGPVSGTNDIDEVATALTGTDDDYAGGTLAAAGDVDGDGIPDLLVGGPGDDDNGEGAGAAWLVAGSSLR